MGSGAQKRLSGARLVLCPQVQSHDPGGRTGCRMNYAAAHSWPLSRTALGRGSGRSAIGWHLSRRIIRSPECVVGPPSARLGGELFQAWQSRVRERPLLSRVDRVRVSELYRSPGMWKHAPVIRPAGTLPITCAGMGVWGWVRGVVEKDNGRVCTHACLRASLSPRWLCGCRPDRDVTQQFGNWKLWASIGTQA